MNIQTQIIKHKGEKRIALQFEYNIEIINKIKVIDGIRWSKTLHCWHIPANEKSGFELKQILGNDYDFNNHKFNSEDLPKNYITGTNTDDTKNKINSLTNFEHWMQSQRYSIKTIKTYTDAIKVFMRFCNQKTLALINNTDVEQFNYEYILKNRYSISYQNQVINAIKLFFKIIEHKAIITEEIKRPRKVYKLPDILSTQEIEKILQSTHNIKHKTMLALIYACGLRRGELLNLKINAIDSHRKILNIKGVKGNKDRITPLPESLIHMLREYYKIYKPSTWLFEGATKNESYTETSIQQVFKKAVQKAGITKKVTLHTLRHSYATHLLENGTDLRYIQELLGHKNSKTTEIYTHVSAQNIEKIKSPFDLLKL